VGNAVFAQAAWRLQLEVPVNPVVYVVVAGAVVVWLLLKRKSLGRLLLEAPVNPVLCALVAVVVAGTLLPVRAGWLDDEDVAVPVLGNAVAPFETIASTMITADENIDSGDLGTGTIRDREDLEGRVAIADIKERVPVDGADLLPAGAPLPDDPRLVELASDTLLASDDIEHGDVVDLVAMPSSDGRLAAGRGAVLTCVIYTGARGGQVGFVVAGGDLPVLAAAGGGATYVVAAVPAEGSDCS
jgi:hypothetical protein